MTGVSCFCHYTSHPLHHLLCSYKDPKKWNHRIADLRKQIEELSERKYGRNLDKDILKQLFIATVTETEKQWTTHFKEDQVCAVVGARDTMMIKADAALTFRSWSPDTDWRQAAVRCVTNAALDQPMVLGEQVDTPPLIFPLIAAWERRI
ncbi:uncharacterized protein LOC112206370 isoform X6 [Pan troglodytes]|uniref:uncharacterized protein LOC112206370 isoform X6 n=1 Tax=Pan troglodytes TaxID=9598 RepID=UPI003013DFFB